MKKTVFIVLSFALIISCNNNNKVKSTALVVASDTATVKYQCPMKCQQDTAYTTEGKCPDCEMDLEKLN